MCLVAEKTKENYSFLFVQGQTHESYLDSQINSAIDFAEEEKKNPNLLVLAY